jgi:tripartite-type tricarboxylate transporter receptor subunit TctC
VRPVVVPNIAFTQRYDILNHRSAIVPILALGCIGAAVSSQAFAQSPGNFPNKPPRILVGFVPGGFTDLAGRIVAQELSEVFGMQVVVDNRPGANGAIAADLTARAAPDGYTFYMASPGHTTNPILRKQAGYDPVKDFTPLSLFADIPNILVVNPTVPARSLKEFLALARKTSMTQASSGIGSPGHLVGELLQMETKVKFIHVPYKGSGAVMSDLIGGQVDFSFPSTAAAMPHVKNGRLRPIAVSSTKRSQAYPDIPTIAEAGVPGFEVMGWYGVLGPARMPKEIVATLSGEIGKMTRKTEVRSRLLAAGAEPVGSTAEEFAAFIASDHQKWSKVIKAANITLN